MTKRRIWSSRPEEEETGFALQSLTEAEVELISSFLWSTRLGSGISVHRDAAFSLMTKIESLKGDDFMEYAAAAVDLTVDVVDDQGNLVETVPQSNVEFVV